MSNSEGISVPEKRPAGERPGGIGAVYTLHPFGGEGLWDRAGNSKPLTASWKLVVPVAQEGAAGMPAHRQPVSRW